MRLAWIAALFFSAAAAQDYEVRPGAVRQGETIRLRAPEAAVAARLNGRTIRLFEGEGLMPVPALEKPGTYALEFMDGGGAVLQSLQVTVRDARFLRQNITISKTLSELKPSPDEADTSEKFRTTVTDVRHWNEPFAPPVPGCRTSPFGVRRFHNGKPTGSYHGGFDQRGATGEPVRAIASGVVRIARMWKLRGGTVAIDHGQGVGSMYLHLSKFAVAEGATVARGDVIGYVGSTGRSTAPHLHWSLYVHGIPVNPAQWVKAPACAAAAPGARKKSGKM